MTAFRRVAHGCGNVVIGIGYLAGAMLFAWVTVASLYLASMGPVATLVWLRDGSLPEATLAGATLAFGVGVGVLKLLRTVEPRLGMGSLMPLCCITSAASLIGAADFAIVISGKSVPDVLRSLSSLMYGRLGL